MAVPLEPKAGCACAVRLADFVIAPVTTPSTTDCTVAVKVSALPVVPVNVRFDAVAR